MELRGVGAGLGRTGPLSLKLALERLLDAPCDPRVEVFAHPEHVRVRHDAVQGLMLPDEPFPRVDTTREFLAGQAPE